MDRKQVILDFIKKQKLAVISTVGIDNKPESAVLEFGETEELELIFDTLTSSRKYKNLQTNKNVSFVVGWDENITVQYEGYWNKNPKAQRWESTEGITYFKVAPKWIRYSDLNKNPWDVFEINI
ncbi:MAG: hypothetical protein UU14_C0026G0007 [Candidatus Roizmanbacteria bacterium GW2011_GWB1_40_7]|uniref:Pyridoxamine 5'-phosphate oxidase N-terminal domain-containing protein n=1 Tax=Candidatus Roizmanbacteria bacterium GW2011_GWB1_40_7 TaxID=1618482 RepID=A0A0G0W8E7_9BACT|nr:MAG: hypothetical protein UU14_C0026G0007 [Candidatus Roizmanbacteria bacterium GW2011_GWB1_40_7]